MKEKLFEAFSDLGFVLEPEENANYSFIYEGMNFLLVYNDSDEEFLSLSLPGIYECEEGKALQACALMEKINSTLKYVKTFICGSSIWLFYERELIGDEDFMKTIPQMIIRLVSALKFARKVMAEIEEATSDASSEEGSEETVAEEVTDNDEEQN